MRKREKDVIVSMFLPAAIVLIFTQVTGVAANIIDGVVTSRFLGADAYSAVSLLGPIANIVLLLASFISIGGQIVCSHRVGTGRRDEANAVFSVSILFGIGIALLFVLFSALSPATLFKICGVSVNERPDLYGHMLHYLRGYTIGIPAVIITQVLSPYLVMDNGKKLVSLSATVLCVADIAGDLLNALVLHGGIFGMGLATSIALWLQLGVLLLHFVRKAGYFRFSLKALTGAHMKEIVKNGALSFVKQLVVVLRDIATNRINLVIAVSTAAVAAKGMQSDLNMLMFCISIGVGQTLLAISSMFYGASDRDGLRRTFTYAMELVVEITLAVGAVLFLIAPLVSRIYTSDPEVLALSTFSIRCMALVLALDGMSAVYQDFQHGVQNHKMVNILCFTERFIIPVAMALLLGKLFGSKGVMASMAASKVLLCALMFIYLCARNKGVPRKAEDFMLLRDDFGGKAEDNLTARIRTMDDVIRESQRARDFCLSHGVSDKQARLMQLFVEEMAGNIVVHGKPRGKGGVSVDFRLFADGDRLCLSLRDYCEAFDPMKYYQLLQSDDIEESLGMRMVMKPAKDIRYINTFNSNCLFINLDARA